MPSKRDIGKQVLRHATGVGTALLYAIVLIVIAFMISVLALRWF